ncbi:hypothetical protein ISS42_02360 [Candidatus Shapirobacteria bacterium]|nr:hypothetical protein [Candidatus Shapirobacteria bacterium]
MADLTSRQINILKAVVEEFIETAEPVGSESLEKKHNFGVCPATLRNEMAKMAQVGYLSKPHSSSGRLPTSMALKYYVRELMTPKKLSVAEEVGMKEKVWEKKHDFNSLLKEATRELSKRSRKMAMSATSQGGTYFSGMAHLLDEPEFLDIDVARMALELVDRVDYWLRIMDSLASSPIDAGEARLLIGHDLGEALLEPCGFVFQEYETGPYKGIIGVMGPARQRYCEVVPMVNYFAQLISEVAR